MTLLANEPRRVVAGADGMRQAVIHMGGVFASKEPVAVRTVLGSCVAACLFDPVTRIGGMNHFLLPDGHGGDELPTRYGVHAMELLINKMMKLGADRRRFRAKTFGGANLFGFAGTDVGAENAEFVREFLRTEGIPVTAERMGGNQGIAVHFFTGTSRALVKPLSRALPDQLARQEIEFRTRLAQRLESEPSDGVVWF